MLVILYNHPFREENHHETFKETHNKLQYILCQNNTCLAPVDDFRELIDNIIE